MKINQILTDLLMAENSRRNTDLISDLVCNKHELFDELMDIYLRNEEPLSRRAALVIDTVAERHPELLDIHLDSIAEALHRFEHDGLKRISLRMIERSPIPENFIGDLMNLCFGWLVSPGESVAVKVYSMEILYRLSEKEPDLKKELADSIEWRIAEETPGFRSRGKKLLKKLNKEMNSGKNR